MGESFTIGIIGAGKVASVLARLWVNAGMHVVTVWNRTPERAESLAQAIDATVAERAADVVTQSDLVVFGVSDDGIQSVADQLTGCDWQERGAVHLSGAVPVSVLASLAEQGAAIGALHPALPFAGVDSALKQVRGAVFAVDAQDDTLRQRLKRLTECIGAIPLTLSGDDKTLYHTALVMASNYTVTLIALAERLLKQVGADEEMTAAIMQPLMRATLENIEQKGTTDALTGPLTRADAGTVQRHLAALDGNPDARDAYIALAKLTVPLLAARGVDDDFLQRIISDD